MGNLDWHTLMDAGVILVTALAAYEGSRLRVEILTLKLWIVENFVNKEDLRSMLTDRDS